MSFSDPDPMGIQVTGDGARLDYRLKFRVKASAHPGVDTMVNLLVFLASRGFFYGAPLLAFPACRCKTVNCDIDRSKIKMMIASATWDWDVVALFSTQFRDDPEAQGSQGGGGGASADPLQRPTRISLRQAKWTDTARKDIDDQPVVNYAGDIVHREKKRSRLVITLEKAVSSFDAVWALEAPKGYLYSRNDASWNPFGVYEPQFGGAFTVLEGDAFIEDLTADLSFDNGGKYVQVHMEVLIDGNQHKDFFWNEGFRAYQTEYEQAVGTAPSLMMDSKTGGFISQPHPLDLNGLKLAEGDAKIELNFQYYVLKNWGLLGIP